MNNSLIDAGQVFANAIRCMVGQRPLVPDHPISLRTILLLAYVFAAVSVAILLPGFFGTWSFNEYGVSDIIARIGVAAGVSCLATSGQGVRHHTFASALAFASIFLAASALAIYGIWFLLPAFSASNPWIYAVVWFGLGFWVLAAAFRAGLKFGFARPVAGGAVSVLAVLSIFTLIPATPLFYSSNLQTARLDIWYLARSLLPATRSTEESDVGGYDTETDWEKLFAEQPDRIKTTLADVASSDDKGHIYFIGMAPYAGQGVFSREVNASREIFDHHFRTEKRSVVLVNSYESLKKDPLASTSNMKSLAAGLKQKIDPAKDVVVLFITSHGSKDIISVENYPLPLNQIKPSDIKEALAATGARNRVVIISACHSGSFIDDLRDDHTTILTASSAEKTSFGCSNERDWTYFTNALFNHGFRETRDIEKAFAIARDLVGKWESRQELVSSDPQIYIGRDVAAAWKVLMPGLDTTTSVPAATPETDSYSEK